MNLQSQTLKAASKNIAVVKNVEIASDAVTANIYSGDQEKRVPDPITFILDNSGGVAVKKFMVGDPIGIIAEEFGLTVFAPTSGTANPAMFKEMNKTRTLIIGAISMEAENSTLQFGQKVTQYSADIDGLASKKTFNLNASKSNQTRNEKQMILNTNFLLNTVTGVTFDVMADEVVSITLSFVYSD